MKITRVISIIIISLMTISCSRNVRKELSEEQNKFKIEVENVKSFDSLFVKDSEVELKVPANEIVDYTVEIFIYSKGFIAVNKLSHNIMLFNNLGIYQAKYGGSGEGPGEFRSIAAAAIDRSDNIYVYDDLLHRISIYSISGKVKNIVEVKRNPPVRHMCVNNDGLIFLHKAPTPNNNYYIDVYDTTG